VKSKEETDSVEDVKQEDKSKDVKKEEEEEEKKPVVRKEPLSLEELLAKKQAQEAERNRVGILVFLP